MPIKSYLQTSKNRGQLEENTQTTNLSNLKSITLSKYVV